MESGSHGDTLIDGAKILAKGSRLMYRDIVKPVLKVGAKAVKIGIKAAQARKKKTAWIDED